MRHGAGYQYRFAFRDLVVEDVRVFVLGLADDVDGDVFAEGFGIAGLEEWLVAQFGCIEADRVRAAVQAACIDFLRNPCVQIAVPQYVPDQPERGGH